LLSSLDRFPSMSFFSISSGFMSIKMPFRRKKYYASGGSDNEKYRSNE
jgi:hypothetical protein